MKARVMAQAQLMHLKALYEQVLLDAPEPQELDNLCQGHVHPQFFLARCMKHSRLEAR